MKLSDFTPSKVFSCSPQSTRYANYITILLPIRNMHGKRQIQSVVPEVKVVAQTYKTVHIEKTRHKQEYVPTRPK